VSLRLDAAVGALIDEDIDHDGDLDLVASTASGEVLIWLNDGHGQFTRQQQRPPLDFTGEPVFSRTEWNDLAARLAAAPVVTSGQGPQAAVIVTQARPPTAPPAFDPLDLLLLAPRAPPTFSV
jgi:hypothetical protein